MTTDQPTAGGNPPTRPGLAWFAWFLGALFYCYGFFQRVAPSVMTDDLMRDFAASGAILGNLTAFYFYAYASLQIPIGLMVDRFGPRRMIAIATLLCGAGSVLFASASGIETAYAGRALIGAGAGVAWIGALQIAGLMFPASRFATLSGLTLLLGMVGAIGAQKPLALMIAAAGWRATLLVAGVVAAGLAVAIWVTVRDSAAPRDRHHAATDFIGLVQGLRAAAGTPQTWTCGLYGAGLGVPVLAFAGLWGVPYMMQTYGLDRPAAALCTTWMLIGWAVGAPVAGWLSDRLHSRRKPMLVAATMGLATLALALYVPGLPLFAVKVLFLVHGVFAGGMVLSFATARENNRLAFGATVVSVVNMTVMGTTAAFQPLIGWLLDLGWDGHMEAGVRIYSAENYSMAMLALMAAGAVSVVAAWLTRETGCRPVGDTIESSKIGEGSG